MSGGIKMKVMVGVGVGLGTAALTGAYYWYQQKVKNDYPKSWKKVGTLSKLAFCPIKSCETIYLNEADCKLMGIEKDQLRDHMFMLIDDADRAVTARTFPHMMKIKQTPTTNGIGVSAPGMKPLKILFSDILDGKTIKADIFHTDVVVVECGAKYNRWFSKFIQNKDEGFRFVYYAHETPTKVVRKDWKNSAFANDDTGTLHDCSSYMLINEKSVEDMNMRLKRPIDAMQFRPNFLVKTDGPAYDEDHWNWIKIGNDAVFRTILPCYRCILPNIDPQTAERDPDGEPLKTLKTYRVIGKSKSPVMGLQLAIRTPGVVNLGDEVYVGV